MKYPKIRALGYDENKDIFSDPEDTIYIQEKIDGGNFRFYVTSMGYIIFGSRTQQLTSNEGEDVNINKQFKRCVEHVREAFKKHRRNYNINHIYYGECCSSHTLVYDWDNIPPFLGFDVYDTKESKWCVTDPDHWKMDLGLEPVPEIEIARAVDIKEFTDKDVPITVYAPKSNPEQQAEGVVFKNYSKGIFAKFVREKFKEDNAIAFGGSPKYSEDDSGKIVLKYCTNARIDKNIFKLVDEGIKLDMPMMAHLPKKVTQDIYEEHWSDILNSNYSLDMRKVRKQITKRCLAVLKQVITNNAF